MIRTLCCWEIGAGYGHLFRLYPIVKNLVGDNHDVSIISRDLPRAEEIFTPLGVISHQAPVNIAPNKLFPYSLNYAQNLLRNGYWHAPSLKIRLKEWLEIYDSARPDFVLAEHAPTALLAARLAGLRCAAIGTGFTVPPPIFPMPTIQPWFGVPLSRLLQIEKDFLALVNPVLKDLGGEPLSEVADFFKDWENFLCTFPELDHYSSRARTSYCGPIVYSPQVRKPDWPDVDGNRVFIYMHAANRFLQPMLDQLKQMDLSVLACIPGIPQSELQKQQHPKLNITTVPVDLEDTARECSLMISQGGSNSGTLMLLRGVPLLVCPSGLERTMWAYRISAQGFGIMINPFNPQHDLQSKIEEALQSKDLRARIQDFARRYKDYDSKQTVRDIANRITMIVN